MDSGSPLCGVRNDGGAYRWRRHNSQIQLSNSPRASTHIHRDVIHRPHFLFGVGSAVIPSSLTHVRERSAGKALRSQSGTLRCRVPCYSGTLASRRSTVAFVVPRDRTSGAGPEGCPSRYPGAFAPFIRSRPAIEGSPRSRADGDPRRPGAGIANPRPQAPHLAPPA